MTLRHILCSFLFALSSAMGAELKTTSAGVELQAGSLGIFTLTYPEFLDAGSAVIHKQTQVSATGQSAVVSYADGVQCQVSLAADEVRLKFSQVPSDVTSWRVTTLVDIGFAKGGTWRVGEESGAFPTSKPKVPQIISKNATEFTIENAQGNRAVFQTPLYAFQQLTDNREWNWAVFHWQCLLPYAQDRNEVSFKVTTDLSSTVKLIDAFGQSIKDHFPNKLLSEDDLKADVAADERYYASLNPPTRDRFGGFPGSGARLGLKKTGFFHVEVKGDKTWLVDPDGNAFFHLGICGFAPNDDYTYLPGREAIYEWLPSPSSEFASAFRPGDGNAHFSFYLANTIKKFGVPYTQDAHTERMISHVRRWGFNSIGAFTPKPPTACEKADFPYVDHLATNEWEGVPRIPGAHEVWDPYDPMTVAKIRSNLAAQLPARANEPLLIGYFAVNEPRLDELARVIPALTGQYACKKALVDFLQKRYGTIAAYNQAWQADSAGFDSLVDVGLNVATAEAKAAVEGFVGEFLKLYFSQVADEFRKHDKNHLLLGHRLQPITIQNEQLCKIMGESVDVVSYNYYTFGVDTAALKNIHRLTGKPMMLSEFFWSSPSDSGLVGGRELKSQQERGFAYRNYVEQSAALGFVVGIEWFTLVDQATTGRWFSKYNGESYNTGLISVADRPWKEMLNEMMKTNYSLDEVLLGARPPYRWDDPRFNGASK